MTEEPVSETPETLPAPKVSAASTTVRPTKKQQELLLFIEEFIKEHGYSPSYREIMNGCQYTSVATVALHVGSLIKRGHLRKRDHSARSLEVVRRPEGTDSVAGEPSQANHAAHEEWLVSRIEAHLRQIREDKSGADLAQDEQLLLSALKILGLGEQADTLQLRLAERPVSKR